MTRIQSEEPTKPYPSLEFSLSFSHPNFADLLYALTHLLPALWGKGPCYHMSVKCQTHLRNCTGNRKKKTKCHCVISFNWVVSLKFHTLDSCSWNLKQAAEQRVPLSAFLPSTSLTFFYSTKEAEIYGKGIWQKEKICPLLQCILFQSCFFFL